MITHVLACVLAVNILNQAGAPILVCDTPAPVELLINTPRIILYTSIPYRSNSLYRLCGPPAALPPPLGDPWACASLPRIIGANDPTLWSGIECAIPFYEWPNRPLIGGVMAGGYQYGSGGAEKRITLSTTGESVFIHVTAGTVPLRVYRGEDADLVARGASDLFVGSTGEVSDVEGGCGFLDTPPPLDLLFYNVK